ncbi:hypothetical protein DSM14862_04102 (plasmid) [Sulfitobacter indolifex]|nr:hypothetical protein DSM14862_04102 [Sulfitobacter indolifex]
MTTAIEQRAVFSPALKRATSMSERSNDRVAVRVVRWKRSAAIALCTTLGYPQRSSGAGVLTSHSRCTPIVFDTALSRR